MCRYERLSSDLNCLSWQCVKAALVRAETPYCALDDLGPSEDDVTGIIMAMSPASLTSIMIAIEPNTTFFKVSSG